MCANGGSVDRPCSVYDQAIEGVLLSKQTPPVLCDLPRAVFHYTSKGAVLNSNPLGSRRF